MLTEAHGNRSAVLEVTSIARSRLAHDVHAVAVRPQLRDVVHNGQQIRGMLTTKSPEEILVVTAKGGRQLIRETVDVERRSLAVVVDENRRTRTFRVREASSALPTSRTKS